MPITTSSVGSTDPAAGGWAVTPGSAYPNGRKARALYIGTAGDVEVTTLGGGVLVFANVPAGTILPVGSSFVDDDNTTASDIIALA